MAFNSLLQIIQQTPGWVFILFFVLLGLGYTQMQSRTVPRLRVVVLPVVLCILSVGGVVAGVGWLAAPLVAWALAYAVVAGVVERMSRPLEYSASQKPGTVQVPGSVVPLVVMMGLFALKYFVGASAGMRASFTTNPYFAVVVSGLYGAFSGVFAGRALHLLQQRYTYAQPKYR